jgi:uncharacterized cupredoxin-like copper-binding protein
MIHAQAGKVQNFFGPQAVGTSAVSGYIDTIGWDYLTVVTNMAAVTTSTSATALAFTEGATTAAADAITELTGGTSTGNFTLPKGSGTSSTGTVTVFHVDLKKRKRYLKLSAELSDETVFTAEALLTRAAVAPVTDAEAGADDVITV